MITHTANKRKSLLQNSLLLVLSVLLFVLSQPNYVFVKGISLLAYIALVPMFILSVQGKGVKAFLWGVLYGSLAYGSLLWWLFSFSALAFWGVVLLYGLFLGILFVLFNNCVLLFEKNATVVFWLLYLAFEFSKTLGFLGFSYGIIGYSQWVFPPIVHIASLFGVWGVSALVVFPSAFIAHFVLFGVFQPIEGMVKEGGKLKHNFKEGLVKNFLAWLGGFWRFCKEKKLLAITYLALFLVLAITPKLLYPALEPQETNFHKIALIQPNSDPWKEDLSYYDSALETLIRLSERAILENPDLDLVVWPETAFVLRIKWHYRFRQDEKAFSLVNKLLQFINSQKVPFLIGNDEAFYDPALTQGLTDIEAGRKDYNAALLFYPKVNCLPPTPEVYYKQKLVPFTETFPYKDLFPKVYEFLLKSDTHFYEAGTENVVFNKEGLSFSVPICFEDTFGSSVRNFAKAGAKLLIAISNDAWSKSLACQNQHLSNAVFRASETGLPLLRSTADGVTCGISSTGKITASLKSFTEGYLIVETSLQEGRKRLYVYVGDLLGWLFIAGALIIVALTILKKLKNKS